MKREKAERFAVYGRVKDDISNTIIEAFIDEYEHYPSDKELENCWEKALNMYNRAYYLEVKKQVRFN